MAKDELSPPFSIHTTISMHVMLAASAPNCGSFGSRAPHIVRETLNFHQHESLTTADFSDWASLHE
jgi:hypothetical protein